MTNAELQAALTLLGFQLHHFYGVDYVAWASGDGRFGDCIWVARGGRSGYYRKDILAAVPFWASGSWEDMSAEFWEALHALWPEVCARAPKFYEDV